MTIEQTPITRKHYQEGSSERIRMVVIHATAGSMPGDDEWLRKGGDARRPVSVHYYITKTGRIFQYLPDAAIAWHAGDSQWTIDGELRSNCNRYSLGIELENRNDGHDPYPEAQFATAVWLTRSLVRRYNIPRSQLVRHLDISPGRKTDPFSLDWERFAMAVYADDPAPPTAPTGYSADTLLLAPPPPAAPSFDAVARHISARPTGKYTPYDVRLIINAYYDLAFACALDPLPIIAQMLHETGNLTSFWAARPQRNPAGIGVTGRKRLDPPRPTTGWRYNTQRRQWEVGISFPDWVNHSVPAHVGRWLAYALPAEQGTAAQRTLIDVALRVRPLPAKVRGSARVLRELGRVHNKSGDGWASPGHDYGDQIARWANALRRAA